MCRRIPIYLFLLALWLSGCKPPAPKAADFAGDVFIVTKGGQNIKLGLVQVHVFPESAFSEFLNSKKKTAELEKAKLKPAYDAAVTAFEEAGAAHQTALAKQEVALQRTIANVQNERLSKEFSAAVDRRFQTMEALRVAAQRLKAMATEYSHWGTCEYLFQGLPTPVATAKTDADGRFSLHLPFATRYGVVAQGQRQVASEAEHYCWAVWVPFEHAPASRFFLSNDNLIEQSGSADNAFRVEPTPTPVILPDK